MISLLALLVLPLSAQHPEVHSEDLAAHIQVLSSDAYEGRGPASAGEEKTIAYLAQQFEAAGLAPGNGDSWYQDVPLLETVPTGAPTASLSNGEELVFGRDLMLWSPVPQGPVALDDSELVFVGYGIVAPEYGWDDYAGLDVEGKTVVMLVNDPGFATQDPELFRGNAMTYYGRWTYKYEEAQRQGAAGALVIHEDAAAGYPWTVVLRSWGGTQFGLDLGAAQQSTRIQGWLAGEAAARLLASVGQDLGKLSERAKAPGAPAVPLGIQASFALTNSSKRSKTRNVIGLLEGAERPDEYVLYCGHWDHLGRKPGGEDEIYNGAVDNASGCAALLELAQSFGSGPRPARSVLFVAVGAEESGLLGSRWYAQHPLYPLERTVAGINIDGLNVLGRMEDIVVVGYGASELDDYLAEAARVQGRRLSEEATPEKGYFYRSDHFNFAKQGVPMLYTDGGNVSRENGAAWVKAQNDEYLKLRYHQPSDEYDPTWDLTGAAEDVRLFEAIGRRLARETRWLEWRPGNEFRGKREASAPARR